MIIRCEYYGTPTDSRGVRSISPHLGCGARRFESCLSDTLVVSSFGLEHHADTVKVAGSNPALPTIRIIQVAEAWLVVENTHNLDNVRITYVVGYGGQMDSKSIGEGSIPSLRAKCKTMKQLFDKH